MHSVFPKEARDTAEAELIGSDYLHYAVVI